MKAPFRLIGDVIGVVHLLLIANVVNAQDMPKQCVQSPARTQACPNLLYKRSPVALASPATQEGEMVCICLSDFAELRIKAGDPSAKEAQQKLAAQQAANLGMAPQTLLDLIQK